MSDADTVPIWLDVDTGHDDAFAILLAALYPKSKLLGISTVHGNAPVQNTSQNTLAVLKAIGCNNVPATQGSARPLIREPCHAPDVHGESGLDGVSLLPHPDQGLVSQSLYEIAATLLAQPPQTAWIVATGPLTNVALMLDAQPSLAEHLAGLSIMGGSIGSGFTDAKLGKLKGEGERFGNTTPFAEFNIYCDPEAAHKIFSHPTLSRKTTLIPLDLTHQVRGTPAVRELLFEGAGAPAWSNIRKLFEEVLTFFSQTYDAIYGIGDGPPLHDPLAVWAALYPDHFDDRSRREMSSEKAERWRSSVVTEGDRFDASVDDQNRLGQTVLGEQVGEGLRIPRGVDKEKFWNAVNDALGLAERQSTIE